MDSSWFRAIPALLLEQLVMESQMLSFALERETKNTIRYSEVANGKPPAIGTLYVQKWLLGQDPPKNLTVTISGSEREEQS